MVLHAQGVHLALEVWVRLGSASGVHSHVLVFARAGQQTLLVREIVIE